MRQLEDLLGEHRARSMHRLHRAPDRVAVIVGIVLGEAAARLHAVGRDPVDHGFAPDNALGPSEGCFDRRLIPGFVKERLIFRVVRPHRGRVRGQRCLGRRNRRQGLVFDREQLGGILCLVKRFCDDEGHRVADIPDELLRQDRLWADESRPARPSSARHQRAQCAEPALPQLITGQDREHTGRPPRRYGIECRDAGMRMRRSHDVATRFVRSPDVVDIPPLAPEKAEILLPPHRHSDRLHTHCPASPRLSRCELSPGAPRVTRFEPEKARLAVPAATHAATPHARKPMTGAATEPTTEAVTETMAKAVSEAVVKVVEAPHDDDRRSEAKKPGRPAPTPIAPAPIRGEIGIGIGFRVRIGRGVW